VRLSHTPSRTSAVFDNPNLVSHGGLVPVMAPAFLYPGERAAAGEGRAGAAGPAHPAGSG
jgi:hypothetical protein